MRRWVETWGGIAEVVTDAHRYGGGLLAAAGIGLWVEPAAALVVFGAWLAYLGLRGRS